MFEFTQNMQKLAHGLLGTTPLHTGEWQSKDVSAVPLYATYELVDASFRIDVPRSSEDWAKTLDPFVNLGWADEHFLERVGGEPLNPPPSHERWPWSRHNEKHQDAATQFAHTYPERMWPKRANPDELMVFKSGRQAEAHTGIRYAYGDLYDVVQLLVRSPLTRQAFLPIWFPEDTGAVWQQRVPCTLGYHFMIRHGVMSMRYYMRSCDLVRHFADDVYLAGRLLQWVCNQWNNETYGMHWAVSDCDALDPPGYRAVTTGHLQMYMASLHAFSGDRYTLEQIEGGRYAK